MKCGARVLLRGLNTAGCSHDSGPVVAYAVGG